MLVELTENVFETRNDGSNAGLKTTIKKRLKVVDAIIEGKPQKALIPDNDVIAWTKGTVIDVSDATGQKLIERKQAKPYEEQSNGGDHLKTPTDDAA